MNDSTQNVSWWKRLSSGLKRSSASLGTAIADLVSKRKLDAEAVEELENELIRADLGPDFAARVVKVLSAGRFEKGIAPDEVKAVLAGEIEKVLAPVAKPLEITTQPFVILVAGVTVPARPPPSASSPPSSVPKERACCWWPATHSAPPPSIN